MTDRLYVIYNVDEMLSFSQGNSYKGEIAVFESGDESDWQFYCKDDKPIYVNAYSHALITSGHSQLYINGDTKRVEAQTLCLISPIHLTCFTQRSPDFKCTFLCIRKNFIESMSNYDLHHHILRGLNTYRHPITNLQDEEFTLLNNCLENIKQQIDRTNHRYQLQLIQNALARYFWEYDNIFYNEDKAIKAEESMQNRYASILQKFTALLLDHFKTEHAVPFYAQQLSMTPQYLTMIVKKQTGRTVSAFISEMLYSEARNLLSTSGNSIQQITDILNFSDQSAFCRFFKRYANLSPQEFRKIKQ